MHRSRMAANVLTLGLTALLTVANVAPAAAACCSLNGSSCESISPLQYPSAFWAGPFCAGASGTVTVTGTNCQVELLADQEIGSGNCITLGSGVTLDLKGHKINCSGTNCGTAISNTASSGSGNKVVIKNGTVTGCWSRGVGVYGGSDSSVSDMTVDLATTASGGAYCTASLPAGIYQPRGTIHRCSVFGALSGIYLYPGGDITDSLIKNNYIGIDNAGASSAVNEFDNVVVFENLYSMNKGTYKPAVTGSTFQAATSCHCRNASNNSCESIENCVGFGTNTDAGHTSYVEEVRYP